MTASGLVDGHRAEVTGSYLVLELRCAGVSWGTTGTAHVELRGDEPADRSWADRAKGAWIESHATYEFITSRGT